MSDARSLPSVGPAEARRLICAALGPSDLKPAYRDAAAGRDPLYGHCYVASQALYFSQGGYDSGWTVWQVQVPGEGSHWFLKNPEGDVVDPTASQFAPGAVPYDRAIKKAWVSQKSFPGPDKRTRRVLARAGLARLDNPTTPKLLAATIDAFKPMVRDGLNDPHVATGLCEEASVLFGQFAAARGHRVRLAKLTIALQSWRASRRSEFGDEVHFAALVDGYVVDWTASQFFGHGTKVPRLWSDPAVWVDAIDKKRMREYEKPILEIVDMPTACWRESGSLEERKENPGGSDWRHFEKDLRRRGWRIESAGSGHLKLYSPGGQHVVVTSSTPSDRRAFDNIKAQVRRAERAEGTERLDNPAFGLSPEDEAKRAAVREFAAEVKREMGLRRFSLAMSVPDGVAGAAPDLALLNFEVDRQNRSQGLGSAVMGRLTQYADDHGYRLVLNPAVRGYGGATSRGRLVAFYKRFGFRENKGRSKDFSIGFAMVRDPHAGLDAGHARDLARMDNPGGSDWRHFEKDLRRRGWRIEHTGGGRGMHVRPPLPHASPAPGVRVAHRGLRRAPGEAVTAARKRGVAAPDPRQTSFVVAKADVERVLDEERGFLVEKRRQAWREGKAAAAERCEGALAAVASLRDRLLGM